VGDSVTCAYGALQAFPCTASPYNQDLMQGYVGVTARALGAHYHAECWSGKGVVRNYGAPNRTSLDPFPVYWNRTLGNRPLPTWPFDAWLPDALVVHLGGNDYSTQPAPSRAQFDFAYARFLDTLSRSYEPQSQHQSQSQSLSQTRSQSQHLQLQSQHLQPQRNYTGPHIFAVCGPMYGDPCAQVRAVLSAWSARNQGRGHFVDARFTLTPDLLGCDYHPNVAGHRLIADRLIPAMREVLNWW
jgi:lysophospholipase L1-like esterase